MTTPKPLTEEDLAEIDRRARAATEGPWRIWSCWCGSIHLNGPIAPEDHDNALDMNEEDEALVNAAPVDVPRLVEEVRRLREENQVLRMNQPGKRLEPDPRTLDGSTPRLPTADD